MYDHISSLKGRFVTTHKTSLTTPLLKEVSVPTPNSEGVCIYGCFDFRRM